MISAAPLLITSFHFYLFKIIIVCSLNAIQEGGVGGGEGAKRHPTSFSPVTSTNVELAPKSF